MIPSGTRQHNANDTYYVYPGHACAIDGNVNRWHWSLDGLRVGGEETIPAISFAPQTEQNVLPPSTGHQTMSFPIRFFRKHVPVTPS